MSPSFFPFVPLRATPLQIDPGFRRHFKVEEIYLGGGLWVLNKPAGVLSHPNPPSREARNAILQVPYDFGAETYFLPGDSGDDGTRRQGIELLHRLDQDTSGVIILSTDPEISAQLKEAFYRHEVEKEYLALVRGLPESREGVWRDQLRRRRGRGPIQVEVVRGGRPNAETCYRVLRHFRSHGVSLLSLHPLTGRTHQLRVQSASRGHPICGDERYGDFAWNRELKAEIGLKRMYLHARRISFRHPKTGRLMRFVAEPGKPLDAPLARINPGAKAKVRTRSAVGARSRRDRRSRGKK